MSCYLHSETATALARRRPLSWRAMFEGAVERMRSRYRRQRQRRELLDYLASDHRAAADLGLKFADAGDWPKRPFGRA